MSPDANSTKRGRAVANGDKTVLQIIVEFDRSLLARYSVPSFNALVDGLMKMGLLPTAWDPRTEQPPVMGVMLDFGNLKRAHYHLDGINLALCWLADASFDGASLRGAILGCCPRASFRGARLDRADFRYSEISGCDFTGSSGIETALWDCAVYDPKCPPVGLPPGILARCRPEADPLPANPREPENPQEPSGPTVAPLRCCATIHEVPLE